MGKAISLKQLKKDLDTLLSPGKFDEKAYNSLQIENTGAIEKVATAVSVSKEVIEMTAKIGAQALVVHHGIFCKGDIHPLVARRYEYVSLLIKHNIALFCYHLPLDAHQELGNNWGAAKLLQLKNCKPFLEYNGALIGVIGETDQSFDSFLKQTTQLYGRKPDAVKMHDTVHNVAIVSGGADGFINQAALAGADTFITGRVDEPVWDAAHEYDVSFLGFGHYATETIGPKLLAHYIEKNLGISSEFIKTNNPF